MDTYEQTGNLAKHIETFAHLKITIENPKGTYKSFVDEDDTENTYPLKGVTYPVDYGSIKGYVGEDGDDLDIFVGSGDICGHITVARPDIENGIETKMVAHVTSEEFESILKAFEPVLLSHAPCTETELLSLIANFKITY